MKFSIDKNPKTNLYGQEESMFLTRVGILGQMMKRSENVVQYIISELELIPNLEYFIDS